MTKAEIIEWLKGKLDPGLFRHSVGTQKYTEELADIYGVDRESAAVAGLVHDCAKSLSSEETLLHADRYRIPMDEIMSAQPALLHAPVGAKLAQIELGISDNEVLGAIEVHCMGARNMSLLEKILYVADASEPSRDHPGVQRVRGLAYGGDLDAALLEAMETKISYVLKRKRMLHPQSVEAWNGVLRRVGNH